MTVSGELLLERASGLVAPHSLVILVENRLDREGLGALAEKEAQFSPILAPNIAAAERMLAAVRPVAFSLLMDQALLTEDIRSLMTSWPPSAVAVLRGDKPPRLRTLKGLQPMQVVCHQTPWLNIASILLAGQPDAVRCLGESNATNGANCHGTRGPAPQPAGVASTNGPIANGMNVANHQSVPPRAPDPAAEELFSKLTRRERQVLELIASGASVRECAATLHIAESTVDNHKSRLMKKLGVRKSTELVRYAFRIGMAS